MASPKKKIRSKPVSTSAGAKALGALPEWNLADLYPALDAPEIKRDLVRVEEDSAVFEQDYKGKLAEMAASADAGAALAKAVQRYEALDELMGRLISYAGLVHAGNTTDPVRSKFYGDVQERLTASSLHLLFFTLELNRVDDALLEAAMGGPALGHYRPWLEDIRKEKPYQLEDKIEQLFHEKSMTGYSAWVRLFDETIAGLRFKVRGRSLAIEPTLNLLQDLPAPSARRQPRRCRRPSRTMCGCSHWSPMRWPRTRIFPTAGAALPTSRIPAICPTASSRKWSRR